jgi:hypothetical protein
MNKLVSSLLVLCVLLAVSGCKQATTTTSDLPDLPTVVLTPLPEQAAELPTATAMPEDDVVDIEEGPVSPEVDQEVTAGTIVRLAWQWDWDLEEDDWFEVHIWPDTPGAQPSVFGWFKDMRLNLTRLSLLPGRYNWSVVVVRGRGSDRVELSGTSYTGTFIMNQPAVVAMLTVTPDKVSVAESTPTPTKVAVTWPTKTPTPVTWWPTATRTPTPVATIPSGLTATPTNTPTGQPTVPAGVTATPTSTATVVAPTATATATSVPPTATATTVPPTATATVAVPTATATQAAYPPPDPAPTATPNQSYPAP